MCSSDLEELDQLAQKLLILDKGLVLDYGPKEELFRKYCGRAVIVVNHCEENEKLLSGFRRLAAPAHLIALSCESAETERKITDLLQENDVNYKRSNNDIEILYTNAKAAKGGNSDAE